MTRGKILGPDLYSGSDAYSGYLATGNVTSFTLTHESGTGGAPKYGVVGQMPWIGSAAVGQSVHASSGFSVPGGVVGNPLLNLTSPRQSSDTATVGHYIANLTIGVDVELAAADRAGMIRYSFHTGGLGQRQVVVDVSHVLPSFRGQGLGQNYLGGGFQVFKDGHYEANGTYNNGWNRGEHRHCRLSSQLSFPSLSCHAFHT
jgi:putative alpha-1,2-mannosidase